MPTAKNKTRLMHVVDYISGDSWNGTHDRSISVVFHSVDKIEVINEYGSHQVKDCFTYEELAGQIESARNARYFSDFCYEMGRNVPLATALADQNSKWSGYYNDVVLGACQPEIDAVVKQGMPKEITVSRRPFRLKTPAP